MEVRSGYKQSDLGVVPKDWAESSVGALQPFVTSGSRGWARYYFDRGDLFVRITNMSRQSIYLDLADCRFVRLPASGHEGARTHLRSGDLLISVTADIGIVSYVDDRVPTPAYINQHIALVRFESQGVDGKFLAYLLAHTPSQDRFCAITDQGAKAGINLTTVRNTRIVLPPLVEQQAIAAALVDVDRLIEALDRLIDKKRDLKQAAMQQLLTGQTRLPGFQGEWEVKRMGEICEIAMGRTPPRLNPAFWGGGYKWLSIADLRAKVVSASNEEITELAASTMTIIPKGTLLMSFKLSLGRLCFAGCDLFTNEAICSFNKLKANAEFLYYLLGRTDFSLYGKQAVKGYTLNMESLKMIAVRLPSLPEQTAIAEVLSAMDAELAALEQRRDKTRALKQGMMQELLTGRTRLV